MTQGQGALYMIELQLSSESVTPGPTVDLQLVVNEPTGQVYGEGALAPAGSAGGGDGAVGFDIRRITGSIVTTGMGPNLVMLQGDYAVPASAGQPARNDGTINLALVVDSEWNGCASFIYGTRGENSCPRAEVQSQQS
jgi:hypothetical protein